MKYKHLFFFIYLFFIVIHTRPLMQRLNKIRALAFLGINFKWTQWLPILFYQGNIWDGYYSENIIITYIWRWISFCYFWFDIDCQFFKLKTKFIIYNWKIETPKLQFFIHRQLVIDLSLYQMYHPIYSRWRWRFSSLIH